MAKKEAEKKANELHAMTREAQLVYDHYNRLAQELTNLLNVLEDWHPAQCCCEADTSPAEDPDF